jgi:hypothetical protein
MKRIICSIVASIPLLFSQSHPCIAQTAQIQQYQVTKGTSIPISIYLTAGQGITLNYDKAKQKVETIWIDNKRFVGIDSDGCIVGLNPSCKRNEATALHLRLIESTANNEADKVERSMITVITVDQKGERYYYIYRIYPERTYSNQESLALIEYIMPSAFNSKYSSKQVMDRIERAKNEGIIRNPQLVERVDKLVGLLKKGINVENSSQDAGISIEFIEGLLK